MIPAALSITRGRLGWVLLGAVLAVSSAYYCGQFVGAQDARTQAQAQLVDVMQAMADRAAELARQDAALVQRHELEQREIVAIFGRMQQEVSDYVATHPVIADCGLDDHGLRIWNAANAGHPAAAAAAEPHAAVSAAATGAVGSAGGATAQPHRDDGAVSPMPSAATRAE